MLVSRGLDSRSKECISICYSLQIYFTELANIINNTPSSGEDSPNIATDKSVKSNLLASIISSSALLHFHELWQEFVYPESEFSLFQDQK